MLVLGARVVRRERVRAAVASIGCIFGVANERLEKGLVAGTYGGEGRDRRPLSVLIGQTG